MPEERIAAVLAELRERRLIAGEDGAHRATARGSQVMSRVVEARRDLLAEVIADPTAERRPEVDALLRRLARELVGERP